VFISLTYRTMAAICSHTLFS